MLWIKRLFFTLFISYIICFLWMFLEYIEQGCITSRETDNAMMCIMMVFIWISVCHYIPDKTKKEELDDTKAE